MMQFCILHSTFCIPIYINELLNFDTEGDIMKTILILFGGKSSEYEVSLQSAYSVLSNIPKEKYRTVLLGITKDGRWLLYEGDEAKIASGDWLNDDCVPAVIGTDFGTKCVIAFRKNGTERIPVDVCFPVLHGKNGEDGTIQGLLELAGIPYVGCGTLASAMCMDKAVTNMTADSFAIPQAKWLSVTRYDYERNKEDFVDRCIEKLGLPIFVKPANAGSSVGISKAKTREDMFKAMETAFREDGKVVAEECIDGREIECAVLGNDAPVASVVGEVLPCNEFYDYNAKYIDGDSVLCIPAELPQEKSDEVRANAVKAFKALGCTGLSRVDFFIRRSDNKVLFNEINTLPGFTAISMYSKLFAESGIPYGELIDRLITLAEERAK